MMLLVKILFGLKSNPGMTPKEYLIYRWFFLKKRFQSGLWSGIKTALRHSYYRLIMLVVNPQSEWVCLDKLELGHPVDIIQEDTRLQDRIRELGKLQRTSIFWTIPAIQQICPSVAPISVIPLANGYHRVIDGNGRVTAMKKALRRYTYIEVLCYGKANKVKPPRIKSS